MLNEQRLLNRIIQQSKILIHCWINCEGAAKFSACEIMVVRVEGHHNTVVLKLSVSFFIMYSMNQWLKLSG